MRQLTQERRVTRREDVCDEGFRNKVMYDLRRCGEDEHEGERVR